MSELQKIPAWLEVFDTRTLQVQRIKLFSSATPFRIGAGFQNELWLDDPHLAAQHLQIEFSEETAQWRINVLPSVNGVRILEGQEIQQPVETGPRPWLNNELYCAGLHRLRLISQASVVNEIPLNASQSAALNSKSVGTETAVAGQGKVNLDSQAQPEGNFVLNALSRWSQVWIIGLLFFIFAAIEWVSLHDRAVVQSKLQEYILPVLMFAGIAFAWALAWSLVTRVFRGDSYFKEHLLIAISTILLTSLVNEVLTFVGMGFALPMIGTVDSLQRVFFMTVAFAASLSLAFPRRPWLTFSSVFGVAIALGGLWAYSGFEQIKRRWYAEYATGSVAPSRQFQSPIKLESFLENFNDQRVKLDAARKEKLEASPLSDSFDDED